MYDLNELVWVSLPDDESFLKIKETLTRMGIASKKDKSLYQSCHILHKQGKYAIVHFKELFLLDGKEADFSESDKARRNTIVNLLAKWKLVNLIDASKTEKPVVADTDIKILSFEDKKNWNLVSKYTVGKKKGS